MVITLMSIFQTLLIATMMCVGFFMLNHAIMLKKINQVKSLHVYIMRSVILLIIMASVLWIDSDIITAKNIGILLYKHSVSCYIMFALSYGLLELTLQKYWNKVLVIFKNNIKHVNQSDNISMINHWKNKK